MDRTEADRLIRGWFGRALEAVDPAAAVARAVAAMPELTAGPPPVVVAIGKAAGAMTAGLVAALPGGIARGVVITKSRETVGAFPAPVDVYEAGHPIPDARTTHATRAALDLLERSKPGEPVVVLISGGGSALFEAPADEVSLDDIAALTGQMLRAGATINELNAVRSRLSLVKAGGLLSYIQDEDPTTLVLSDVIGNGLAVIASGPTVIGEAEGSPRAVLERLGLWTSVPSRLRDRIDTPVQAPRARGKRRHHIVADNNTAIDAFAAAAGEAATVDVAWRQRTGEARELAVDWVAACRAASDAVGVLVGGGEATVTVRGEGVGGRNTEFAVAAAIELAQLGEHGWIVSSLATDGDDGPTGSAGGIASAQSVRIAREAGIDARAALAVNDTLRVLESSGGVVRTGPTGTNVNDLYVAVRVR